MPWRDLEHLDSLKTNIYKMENNGFPKVLPSKQEVRQTKKIQYEDYLVEVKTVDGIPHQAMLRWGSWFELPNTEGLKHFLIDPKKQGVVIDLYRDDVRKIFDALYFLKQNT